MLAQLLGAELGVVLVELNLYQGLDPRIEQLAQRAKKLRRRRQHQLPVLAGRMLLQQEARDAAREELGFMLGRRLRRLVATGGKAPPVLWMLLPAEVGPVRSDSVSEVRIRIVVLTMSLISCSASPACACEKTRARPALAAIIQVSSI